jgi:hypothetical protein
MEEVGQALVAQKLVSIFSGAARPRIPFSVNEAAEGTDIYQFPFFSPMLADEIAQVAENAQYEPSLTSSGGGRDHRRSHGFFMHEISRALLESFVSYASEPLYYAVRHAWQWTFSNIADVSLLRYEPGEFYLRHIDAADSQLCAMRQVSFVVYLSDDFSGGNTYFPRQMVSIVPKKGSAVIFPSGITHPHEAQSISSGVKYVIVGWLFRAA